MPHGGIALFLYNEQRYYFVALGVSLTSTPVLASARHFNHISIFYFNAQPLNYLHSFTSY